MGVVEEQRQQLVTLEARLAAMEAPEGTRSVIGDKGERPASTPSPAPRGPREPWVADVRSGCVAVYLGPKENCLDGMSRDPRCVFFRSGEYKDEGYWNLDVQYIIEAEALAATLNRVTPAIERAAYERGVRAFAYWLAERKEDGYDISPLKASAERFLAERSDP